VAVGVYDPRLGAAVLVTHPVAHVRLLADQVVATVKGVGVYRFIFFGSAPVAGDRHLIAWGASVLLGGLGALLVPPGRSQRLFIAFFAVFGVALLLELACIQRAIGPHHAVMLSPTWILCWAGLVDEPLRLLARPFRSFRQWTAVACAGLAFLGPAATSVLVSSAYWARLGGPFPANWDPATASLALYALSNDTREYVSVDWGTHTVLQGLTQGQVLCLDLWPAFKEPAAHPLPAFAGVTPVFVLHAPGTETFPEAQAHFWTIARKEGWNLELAARVPSSEGRPLLEAYRSGRPPQ